MFKHYIRTNESGEVIAAFSSAFQDPADGDILVADNAERHFRLQLTDQGIARYTWDGESVVERTAEEIEAIAAPAKEQALILWRLAELDEIIVRSVEDLYAATKTTPHAAVKAAMDEKATLRGKLKK